MNVVKEWWASRYSVVHVMLRVAFSGVYLHLVVLDYGLTVGVSLPYILDTLNPIRLVTMWLFRLLLTACGKSYGVSLWKFWKLSAHKGFELELADSCNMFAFDYHWTVHFDHWGHQVDVAVAGLELSAHFRDNRHWNDEQNAPQD